MAKIEVEIPMNVIVRVLPSLLSVPEVAARLERATKHHGECRESLCDTRFLLGLLGGAKLETAHVNRGASLPTVPAHRFVAYCKCSLCAASTGESI